MGANARLETVPFPRAMTPRELRAELLFTQYAVHRAIGRYPRLVRPPFLEWTPENVARADTMGFSVVSVSLDSEDWKEASPATGGGRNAAATAKVVEKVKRQLANDATGAFISLQHDTLLFVRSQ